MSALHPRPERRGFTRVLVKLLAQFLEANPLVKDARGFTVLDDFDHLCAYSGLAEADELSIAWGRYSYVSASYRKRQAGAPA